MKTRTRYYVIGVIFTILPGLFAGQATADTQTFADVLCYCEIGTHPAGTPLAWRNPLNAITQDELNPGISLGNWTDATIENSPSGDPLFLPSRLTGGCNLNQGYSPGLVVGFSTAVNNGSGNDICVKGNPFDINGSDYYWSEPGYIEVAMETTVLGQTGATADGWMDEMFYMIKPSNYDIVGDPRLGPISGIYDFMDDPSGALDNQGNPMQVQVWTGSWGVDLIAAGGSQLDLYGYADWNPAGDRVDISDAIDLDGNYVSLPNIAYVRVRTVTNDDAGIFGSISTEVCYVEDISVVPEPAAMALLAVGGMSMVMRRRRRA
ncbi:MAG: PEP-CTERM sorting domain-containing protein [Phycisphaerales bacterium]|nr:PEP-CTERM sorting domain-containing protein [Phycisphaerales bacterium]